MDEQEDYDCEDVYVEGITFSNQEEVPTTASGFGGEFYHEFEEEEDPEPYSSQA